MLPLFSSSPMLTRPTLGLLLFMTFSIYMLPIIANSSRFSALHSEFAPASRSSDASPLPRTGYTLARAGLSIPWILPSMKRPPARSAPVLPADTKRSPSPSLTISRPLTMEESFFERIAFTGASFIDMTCCASLMLILDSS